MFELLTILGKILKLIPKLKILFIRKIQRAVRGYHVLRKSDLLHVPAELKSKVETTRILPEGEGLSPHIFGKIGVDHDLIVRQFLLSRYFCPYSRFNSSLLSAIGSVKRILYFPLPRDWRKVLTGANYVRDTPLNSWLWRVEIFMYWLGGLKNILAVAANSFGGIVSRPSWPSNYAFFSGISEEMLTDPAYAVPERFIFNWYAAWSEKGESVTTLAHTAPSNGRSDISGMKIVPIKMDIPLLPSFSALLKFVMWGASASILSLGRMVVGKWWDALLLAEAAKAKLVRLAPDERLAREYFFMYDWTYRPIWTYFAESRGSKIFFFFYSTNSEQFKTKTGYIPLLFDWRPINWPNYIVWDRYQADFIVRHSRFDAEYHIAGPMHLSGKVPLETDIKKKSIAVFDVMPMRRSIYATLGLSKEYFVPKTCKGFVQDIIKIASELDCHVYLKTKRTISKRVDASYRHLLESVHNFDNVTVLSGDYPAETLIKKTAASVSMPWTSTALMAKYFSKPSCYYDASESLFHDDRGAHGVHVCIGIKELRQYLAPLVDDASDCDVPSDSLVRRESPPLH